MLAVLGILLKILIVVGIAQGTVAYLILVERKVAAFAQDRIGPNRAGREFGLPYGLLQPLFSRRCISLPAHQVDAPKKRLIRPNVLLRP